MSLCLVWDLEYLEESNMTLEKKFELLKAYEEGKRIEVYDTMSNKWREKLQDIWDFNYCQYRIRSNDTLKFKVNDVLVHRGDANRPSPNLYTVMSIDNNGYTINGDEFEKSPSIIEKEYISERDVLWYFEWRTAKGQFTTDPENSRLTVDEAIEIVKDFPNLVECYPIRVLGFRLPKEN